MVPLLLLITCAFAQDFSFVVVGDTQTAGGNSSINWQVFPSIVESANTHDPALMIVAGDLVGGGGTPSETVLQWQDFNTAIAGFVGAVYMVPGNHDVYGGIGTFDAWRDTFPWLPTDDSPRDEEGVSYHIDYGNTRFVLVTSDGEDGRFGELSSAAWAGSTVC